MKLKNISMAISVLLILFLISACTPANNSDSDLEEELQAKNDIIATLESDNRELQEEINNLNKKIEELEGQTPSETQVTSHLTATLEAVELLSNEDMDGLAAIAHPVKGIRFTPYSYIDTSSDQVFTASQIANLMSDTTVYTWGDYDGSGEPINKTFADYYDEFVYDEDYANPHIIGNNTLIGKGNSIDNLTDVYTNGEFVEFHFTGFDAQYEGMDWSSLKLVLEEDDGTWYLVGIIHSQWTI